MRADLIVVESLMTYCRPVEDSGLKVHPTTTGLEGRLLVAGASRSLALVEMRSHRACIGYDSHGVRDISSYLDCCQCADDFFRHSALLYDHLSDLRDKCPLHTAAWRCPHTRGRQQLSLCQGIGA
jgi:hypothetical protein